VTYKDIYLRTCFRQIWHHFHPSNAWTPNALLTHRKKIHSSWSLLTLT